jgi:hypothetical protein
VADKPENKQLIFSQASLEKLAQLKNAKSWILWIKERIEGAEA